MFIHLAEFQCLWLKTCLKLTFTLTVYEHIHMNKDKPVNYDIFMLSISHVFFK